EGVVDVVEPLAGRRGQLAVLEAHRRGRVIDLVFGLELLDRRIERHVDEPEVVQLRRRLLALATHVAINDDLLPEPERAVRRRLVPLHLEGRWAERGYRDQAEAITVRLLPRLDLLIDRHAEPHVRHGPGVVVVKAQRERALYAGVGAGVEVH